VLKLALWVSGLLLTGCATPGSTRMTAGDFEDMAGAMAQSLLSSEAIAARVPESEPWVISIQRVRNLSSDVITESEQWAVMARIKDAAPIETLHERKNIRFVLPAAQVARLRASERFAAPASAPARRDPTHVMTATFRSTTRASGRERTEAYFCEFELTDLRDGTPMWVDRFEYKRTATGHILD
jgi:hypothetical protein